jgi:hypothetical protein
MFNLFKRKRYEKLDWRTLEVEPTDSKDTGPCPCCGNMSRTVWGFVHSSDSTVAAYFVQWTLNNPEHGANFDLIIGQWNEESEPNQRQAVCMEYRVFDGFGSFMVIDASTRPVASSDLAGEILSREQVIDKPVAQRAFAIADAIIMRDERVEEVRKW